MSAERVGMIMKTKGKGRERVRERETLGEREDVLRLTGGERAVDGFDDLDC